MSFPIRTVLQRRKKGIAKCTKENCATIYVASAFSQVQSCKFVCKITKHLLLLLLPGSVNAGDREKRVKYHSLCVIYSCRSSASCLKTALKQSEIYNAFLKILTLFIV